MLKTHVKVEEVDREVEWRGQGLGDRGQGTGEETGDGEETGEETGNRTQGTGHRAQGTENREQRRKRDRTYNTQGRTCCSSVMSSERNLTSSNCLLICTSSHA